MHFIIRTLTDFQYATNVRFTQLKRFFSLEPDGKTEIFLAITQ